MPGRKIEDRRQWSVVRRQRTEDRGQRAEDRRQKTEVRGRRSEDRRQRSAQPPAGLKGAGPGTGPPYQEDPVAVFKEAAGFERMVPL